MRKQYSLLFLLILSITFIACKEPEARKPISVKTGTFLKESIERNKALLAQEEAIIKQIIAKDSIHEYKASANGFWYYYNKIDSTSNYLPKEDDLVTLTYNINTLNNTPIYTQQEIGIITYRVDKQELFPGLRAGVKLIRKGETVTFLFPSSLAFGYHGDNNKIGTNVPIKCTVTILDINPQNNNK